MLTVQDTARTQSGFSMVEVLVALVILLVGLLGLAGLMAESQRSEMESYQRVQALILAKDMVARINANRNVAFNQPACYGFTNATAGTPFVGSPTVGGGPASAPVCATVAGVTTNAQIALANRDLAEWGAVLQGAAEVSAAGTTGAMIGARGCITYNGAAYNTAANPDGELLDVNGLPISGTGVYTVQVAWQGTSRTFAPSANLNCARGMYGDEMQRRVLSLPFRIGSVNNTQAPGTFP